MRSFAVADDGTLSGGEVLATSTSGGFDGFRLDDAGRIWTSAGDGVHCLDPDGTLLGKIPIPEVVANVEFGGPKRNRLFICATTSLYSVHLMVTGPRRSAASDRRP
jgi:gluconolactonase